MRSTIIILLLLLAVSVLAFEEAIFRDKKVASRNLRSAEYERIFGKTTGAPVPHARHLAPGSCISDEQCGDLLKYFCENGDCVEWDFHGKP